MTAKELREMMETLHKKYPLQNILTNYCSDCGAELRKDGSCTVCDHRCRGRYPDDSICMMCGDSLV